MNTTSTKELKVYSDGGSRGNPGNAGCGVIIFNYNNELIDFDSFYIGIATNNQAEYLAFERAVEMVANLLPKKVTFFLDSELIVKQITGEYKVRNKELATMLKRIQKKLKLTKNWEIQHIERTHNSFADKLVNLATDNALSK